MAERTHRLSVSTNDHGNMVKRVYAYEVNFEVCIPLEQVEAHAKNMLRILDEQANDDSPDGEDEDDESGKWHKA